MKLLASDLDGTLFFPNIEKGYKDWDIEAIKQFQKEGNKFGCCTGRALYGATVSFENLLDCDFYIATSGAVIADKDLNIIYDCPIAFEQVKQICDDYLGRVEVFIQTLRYYSFADDRPQSMFKTIKTIDELKNEKIYGLCLVTKDHDLLDEVELELKEKYPEVSGFKNIDAIDIVVKGCSKGNALIKVKELFNAKTGYGIGDSYNDIPLLQKADISFTFYTSPSAVKEAATMLVESIEEAIQTMK